MSCDYIINGNKITSYIGNGGDIIIPDGITELDEYCFTKFVHKQEYDNGTLKEYVAVNFDTKKNIKSIFIPNSVNKLDESTFSELVNLEKVTFQSGSQLKEIPGLAFTGCKSLKSIVLPDSVTYIDSYAFSDCGEIVVHVGKDCKVNDLVFGSGEHLSRGAKIIHSYNSTLKETYTDSDTKSYSDFDESSLIIFLIIMVFVYLVAFVFTLFIDATAVTIIVIILGIINLIALLISFINY